jgi:signal transduction histidine kinase
MQAENEILVMISVGIFAMAILVMAVVVFVALYHQRGIKNRLDIEKIKLQQSEELIKSITEVQELERKRISTQLHDEVGVSLSAVNMLIGRVGMNSDGANKGLITEAGTQINQIITGVRSIVQNMSPNFIERFGLIDSINEICMRINMGGQISSTFKNNFLNLKVSNKSTELIIYRIVQELSNNVLKHSQASIMEIVIERNDDMMRLSVSDNGVGIKIDNAFMKKSLGLSNIKNRVEILGGHFSINNGLEGGTVAILEIPVIQLN